MSIDAQNDSLVERNGRVLYHKRTADQEQYVIYLREGLAGKEQVLFDLNPLSPDHSTNGDISDVTSSGEQDYSRSAVCPRSMLLISEHGRLVTMDTSGNLLKIQKNSDTVKQLDGGRSFKVADSNSHSRRPCE